MKNTTRKLVIVFSVVSVLLVSCASTRVGGKKDCGCGSHKGYVGY